MVGPGPEEGGRRDPGLFNVPEDDEDDEDDEGDEGDARSRVTQ